MHAFLVLSSPHASVLGIKKSIRGVSQSYRGLVLLKGSKVVMRLPIWHNLATQRTPTIQRMRPRLARSFCRRCLAGGRRQEKPRVFQATITIRTDYEAIHGKSQSQTNRLPPSTSIPAVPLVNLPFFSPHFAEMCSHQARKGKHTPGTQSKIAQSFSQLETTI